MPRFTCTDLVKASIAVTIRRVGGSHKHYPDPSTKGLQAHTQIHIDTHMAELSGVEQLVTSGSRHYRAAKHPTPIGLAAGVGESQENKEGKSINVH
jgi:hypothetical protein